MAELTLQHTAAQINRGVQTGLDLEPHKDVLKKFDAKDGRPIFENEPIGGIDDAPADNHLYGRINNDWQSIPAHSVDLMFWTLEGENPVASHIAPATAQTILPITHFPSNPGTPHDIARFAIADDLHGTELEFVPGNSFQSMHWIRSDMARPGTLFRLTAIDTRTGSQLATGATEIDLGQIGELQPLLIPGLYKIPAVVPAESIEMLLQATTSQFGMQIGIFSIPPNEISYIARLISGPTIPLPPNDDKAYGMRNGEWIPLAGAVWFEGM